MAYWLMKQEPSEWGWNDLVAEGKSHWDGVRNHQAAANLRKMVRVTAASCTIRSMRSRSWASWR